MLAYGGGGGYDVGMFGVLEIKSFSPMQCHVLLPLSPKGPREETVFDSEQCVVVVGDDGDDDNGDEVCS